MLQHLSWLKALFRWLRPLVVCLVLFFAVFLMIDLWLPQSPEKTRLRAATAPEYRQDIAAGGQNYDIIASTLLTHDDKMIEAELLMPKRTGGQPIGITVISTALQVWPDRSFVPDLMGSQALLLINTGRAQEVTFANPLPPIEAGLTNFMQRVAPVGRFENFMAIRTAFHAAPGNIVKHVLWGIKDLNIDPTRITLIGYGAGAAIATRAAAALEQMGYRPAAVGLIFPSLEMPRLLSPVLTNSYVLLPVLWRRLGLEHNLAYVTAPKMLLVSEDDVTQVRQFNASQGGMEVIGMPLTDHPIAMRIEAQQTVRQWLATKGLVGGGK